MNRQIKIYMGDARRFVGNMYFNAIGNRENCSLEYSHEWIEEEGFEIDPSLPRRFGRFFRSLKEGASVFPGAIADSEPDGWARQVILRDYAKHRKEEKDHGLSNTYLPLNSLDFLLAVDDFSRIGALRFKDENGAFQRTGEKGKGRRAPPLIELGALLQASNAVETDADTAADLEYLRGKGTSLGGLRPKCTIIDEDGSLSIGKFPSIRDTYSVTKGEVLALRIAKAAGIHAAQARIVESEGVSVAIIKRFDRGDGEIRIPYISAATLLGIENSYDIHTYTEIVDALKRYSADFQSDAEELWKRIALSIMITNVDDHMRNHGFLHIEKNLWRLSPVFDINPFPDKRRVLKTWIAENTGDAASIHLLMETSPYFGINHKRALALLANVETAVSQWRQIGKSLGITTAQLNNFESAFEHEERVYARQILKNI